MSHEKNNESKINILIKNWHSKITKIRKTKSDPLRLLEQELNKSIPMLVEKAIVYKNGDAYWICPNCNTTFEREYQKYCDRCGQHLKWGSLKNIKYIHFDLLEESSKIKY